MNKRSISTINLKQAPTLLPADKENYYSIPQNYHENRQTHLRKRILSTQGASTDEEPTCKSKKDRVQLIAKVSVPTDQVNYLFFKNSHPQSIRNSCKQQQGKLGSLNFKNKSVYEQYRERIEKGLPTLSCKENRNPQLQTLKQQNQELKSSMLEDIKRLRLVREKSQKSLKKCHSTKLQTVKETKVTKVQMDSEEVKKRALAKNREKLAKMR